VKHSIDMVEITAWVKGMNMLEAKGVITIDTMTFVVVVAIIGPYYIVEMVPLRILRRFLRLSKKEKKIIAQSDEVGKRSPPTGPCGGCARCSRPGHLPQDVVGFRPHIYDGAVEQTASGCFPFEINSPVAPRRRRASCRIGHVVDLIVIGGGRRVVVVVFVVGLFVVVGGGGALPGGCGGGSL